MADSFNPDWLQEFVRPSRLLDPDNGIEIDDGDDFPDDIYVVVTGFWKPGWNQAHPAVRTVRLYTSLDLNEYIEFDRGSIRHIVRERYAESVDRALVSVVVWLDRGTIANHALRAVDRSVTRQEGFLIGDIVDTYYATSSPELPTRAGRGVAAWLRSIIQPCSGGGCGSTQCQTCNQPLTNDRTNG